MPTLPSEAVRRAGLFSRGQPFFTRVGGKTMVMMKRRIAQFPLVALSTFVAGAVTVAAAWYLRQELAEFAEQNGVRS